MTTTRSPDLSVVLIRGPDRREVPLVALAAAARTPCEQLRHACEFLLQAPEVLTTEQSREGDPGGESPLHSALPCNEVMKMHCMDDREGLGVTAALTADSLAARLHSPQSVPFFQQLLALHDERHVRRALERALTVAPDKLRTTRGAYFVGVLRQLTGRRLQTPTRTDSSHPARYA